MAQPWWRWVVERFGTFVGQVSRQLSDVWTAPTAVRPHLVELGVVDRADRVGGVTGLSLLDGRKREVSRQS